MIINIKPHKDYIQNYITIIDLMINQLNYGMKII